MKVIVTTLIIALLTSGLTTHEAFGQNEQDDMLNMSLEDLMNLTVTSASKKEEKASNAPSIITTITAKEIEDFGGSNLYEILERAPSFYGISSFVFRKNVIGLRGDLPGHINPRILFLIDGRPFRESILGGQNVSILTTFPIYSIKQIEIIRGPGSVLYGSNAYTGVVNIITKESSEPNLTARAGVGSFGTKNVQINGGTYLGDLKINGGLNYFKSSGWYFSDSTTVRGPSRSIGQADFGEDIIAGNIDLAYKGFSLSGFYGSNEMGHITPVTSAAGIYKSKRVFVDFGYSKEIIQDIYSISTNVTYNKIADDFDIGFFNNESSVRLPSSDDYVFELTNFFNIKDNLEVTVGGSFYLLSGEFKTRTAFSSVPAYSDKWIHGYAQADFQPTDWLKLVVGGQLNKVADLDINFVPRLAAIASLPSGLGAKIMYGKAFRAPYATETDVFAPPSVEGDPNLVPENVSTFESQLFYTTDVGRVAITYFQSNQTDLITRIPNTNPASAASLVYTNLGELKSQGIEIETKYSLTEGVYINGSYSYYTNEDNNGNKNVSRLPQHMLKMGVSYNIKNYVNLGVFNSYYSSTFDSPTSNESLGQLSAFNWLTARLDIKIDQLLKLESQKIGLVIEGVNLLDKKVYNPEILFRNFNAVQNHPGMALNISAYVKF